MTRQSSRDGAGSPPGAYRHGRPRPPRRSWAALAGYLGLTLAGLAVAVAAAAVILLLVAPPLDAVRDRLVQQVHRRTGRVLTVAGPMSVSLVPRPVVTVRGVALAAPEGMAGGPTVTVPSLAAEVSLWSLLSRRPKLERVTLSRPTIDLLVDAQGRRSWDAGAMPKAPGSPASAAPAAETSTGDPSSRPAAQASARRRRPVLVRVEGGTVRYRDARTGAAYEVGSLDLDVTMDTPEAAFAAVGGFAWEGVPFRLSASLADRSAGTATIRIAGAPFDITYSGSLALQGGKGSLAAEGTLSVAHLAYKDVKLGPATLALSVAGGAGKVTLPETAMYDGRAQGELTFDTAPGAQQALAGRLELTGVALQALLQDAAGVAWLDGRATLGVVLGAVPGGAGRITVDRLAGQVRLSVADGALSGVDIDRLMRAVQRGRLDRLAPRRDDRTPFSAMTGTFDIASGVAKTSDLLLTSQHVELKGEGQIDLAARRIDATLQTRIEGGPPAEDAVVKIGTVELPVAIKGPLERPEFSIKGQEALSEAIGRIGKNLKSRDVKDAIDGLLSGDKSKKVKPAELLEKLLRKD